MHYPMGFSAERKVSCHAQMILLYIKQEFYSSVSDPYNNLLILWPSCNPENIVLGHTLDFCCVYGLELSDLYLMLY